MVLFSYASKVKFLGYFIFVRMFDWGQSLLCSQAEFQRTFCFGETSVRVGNRAGSMTWWVKNSMYPIRSGLSSVFGGGVAYKVLVPKLFISTWRSFFRFFIVDGGWS
jgi:hypothetical protein